MATTWTKITKASGTSYTKVSPPGSARYGYGKYGTATYGDNGGVWTKLAKGIGGDILATAGMFMGVGSLTYSGGQVLSTGIWTKIPKGT